MKITVLNGSPKGNLSVTMQYVNFIQKKFPHHEFKILNIASQIKKIEKDTEAFQEIMDEVRSSEGVLWAFPLYVFLVSSQYKRFIELLWEKKLEGVFKNKYTSALTTSIHFFDHTAHNYIRAICDDLDMKFAGSFSAGMYDLLREKERKELITFAENFFQAIETQIPTIKSFQPLTDRKFDYAPGAAEEKIKTDKKVILLTDCTDPQTNLGRMTEKLRSSFLNGIEVVNLYDIDIKGGCLGCIQCGYNYECTYTGKDEFIEFYNTRLKTADVLIFAGTIQDRYLSSRWKLFFDRGFFNTHTPSFMGKQMGFIISGPLGQLPNLRQIFEGYVEWQQANLVDFVTDEYGGSLQIDATLQNFARRLISLSEKHYVKPPTFLGVGGMKIFRDDIWGKLRFPFQADHSFYKRHGLYDFPQRDYKTRIIVTLLMLLTKIPTMRKEIYRRRMREEMIKPLQKILKKV
ncbi:MAG: NAD(P)H-dependent oxidoreductase [Thermodesulfobacteriota bacterium]